MQLNSTGPPQGTQVLLGTTWKAENVNKTMVASYPKLLTTQTDRSGVSQSRKKHIAHFKNRNVVVTGVCGDAHRQFLVFLRALHSSSRGKYILEVIINNICN